MTLINILFLILGIALLVSGRHLFWLLVGAAGFFAGFEIVSTVFKGPEWLSLFIGLAAGILFAMLAIFLKSIAISIAGFILGGSLLASAATTFGFESANSWVVFIIGGIIGIILVNIIFDWALIGLSSFGGASLIVQAFDMKGALAAIVFIVLIILGIVIQLTHLRFGKRRNAR